MICLRCGRTGGMCLCPLTGSEPLPGPIAGDAPYQPLRHVAELEAEVERLRGERDVYRAACRESESDVDSLQRKNELLIQTVEAQKSGNTLLAFITANVELGHVNLELHDRLHDAAKVANYAESSLARIQEIAQNHGDGAEDAHPLDREMSRIDAICGGEDIG